MNFKRIFRQIYLITATLIYMVAVIIVLVGIVVFAILNEFSKQVQLSQKNIPSKSKKLEYIRVFQSIKTDDTSLKEKMLLTISNNKK